MSAGRIHDIDKVTVLSPDDVARQLEDVIRDLQGFVMPVLEAETGSVDAAVVCEMNIAQLQTMIKSLERISGNGR
jgi:hypothetical protein